MNDHNLDDLIIDDIQPEQSNKAKSFLTIIALAIVVLIVSIIFTKILLKAPKQDQLLFEQNETEMISPDLTLQSATEPEDRTSEPLESTQEDNRLQISQETSTEEVTEKVPAPAEETTEIEEPQTSETQQPEETLEQPKEVPVSKPTETEEEPTPATMPKAEEERAAEILDIVEQPSRTTRKSTVEEPKQKVQSTKNQSIEQAEEISRPANVITRPQEKHMRSTSSGTYYIQVGAFSNAPSQRFLNRITSYGFNYTITKRSPKGYKKLLIGPFTDKKTAEEALKKVRDRINKSAFLLK